MTNQKDLYRESKEIPRPEGWMENPFIGKDGRDYHSVEALETANREYAERMFRIIPKKEQ